MGKYLDFNGLSTLWGKIKDKFVTKTDFNSAMSQKQNSLGINPTGSANKFLNQQGSFVSVETDLSAYAKKTDIPTTLPASDVKAWAKADSKPSYTKSEVGLGNVDNTADSAKDVNHAKSADSVAWSGVTGKPTTLDGYGITDAYTKDQTDERINELAANVGGTSNYEIAVVDTIPAPGSTGWLSHTFPKPIGIPVFVAATFREAAGSIAVRNPSSQGFVYYVSDAGKDSPVNIVVVHIPESKVLPYICQEAGIEKYESFEDLAASSTAMTAVAASSTAMTAVAASSTAWSAVMANSTAYNIVVNSSTAMTAVAASSTAWSAVMANSTAYNIVVNSSTAMTAVAASSTAMTAVAASANALQAIVKNANASKLVAYSIQNYRTQILNTLKSSSGTALFSSKSEQTNEATGTAKTTLGENTNTFYFPYECNDDNDTDFYVYYGNSTSNKQIAYVEKHSGSSSITSGVSLRGVTVLENGNTVGYVKFFVYTAK